jgi:hypothetical protein
LLKQINDNETDTNSELNKFKHDVDILFKDRITKAVYYAEVKYNDDHDTGKFTDINRKFLKTYAYLARVLKQDNSDVKLKPLLIYFNDKKMKGNIYLPESEVIYRGKRFFDEFTTVDYAELEKCIDSISESDGTINMFRKLYDKIVKNTDVWRKDG